MAKKRGNKNEAEEKVEATVEVEAKNEREMTDEEKKDQADGAVIEKAQAEENALIESQLRAALEGEDRKNTARIRAIVTNIAGKSSRLSIDKNGTANVELESGLQIKI